MLVNHYFSEGFLKFPYYILLQDEYIWWWMDLGNARLYDVERFFSYQVSLLAIENGHWKSM